MTKGSLGRLAAYWPEGTARHAYIPLERVTVGCAWNPAAGSADAVALVAGDETVRYGEMAARLERAVAILRADAAGAERLAVLLDDPLDEVVWTLAAMELDLLAWTPGPRPEAEQLASFEPDLVVSDDPPGGYRVTRPGDPHPGHDASSGTRQPGSGGHRPKGAGRPNLRAPIAALAGGSGEVLHTHKTLLATAISLSSFFLLEPGADVAVLAPPSTWVGLAMLLATWYRGGTVHAAWRRPDGAVTGRFDYAVDVWDGRSEAVASRLAGDARVGVGLVAGVSDVFDVSLRRRLARRVGAPLLTMLGSNEHGPYVASHPTWYLDGSPGIPLPNVDTWPLDPADGRELGIGWEVVEEAEIGLKSALAPAGATPAGSWLKTRLVGHVDPTGLYFLRRRATESDRPPARSHPFGPVTPGSS